MSDPGKRVGTWVPSKVWKSATLAAADKDETLGAFIHDAIRDAAQRWEDEKAAAWERCLRDCIKSFAEKEAWEAKNKRPRDWRAQQVAMIALWDAHGHYRPGEKEQALANVHGYWPKDPKGSEVLLSTRRADGR